MNSLPAGVERIVFFDGHCNFCNFWGKFLLQADKGKRLHFATLQSNTARRLLGSFTKLDLSETVVLLERERIATRSTAVLRLLWILGGFWRTTAIFYVIPRFVRDPLYDFVAKRRYRWFGRREQCPVPTAAERGRFLD